MYPVYLPTYRIGYFQTPVWACTEFHRWKCSYRVSSALLFSPCGFDTLFAMEMLQHPMLLLYIKSFRYWCITFDIINTGFEDLRVPCQKKNTWICTNYRVRMLARQTIVPPHQPRAKMELENILLVDIHTSVEVSICLTSRS